MRHISYGHRSGAVAVHLLAVVGVFCAGCKKADQDSTAAPSPVQQNALGQSGPAEPSIVACSLITKAEVAAIQKATITDARSSAGPSGNLVMSQCYYTANEPNMSVSLAVLQPSSRSASGREAREYWDDTLRRSAEQPSGEPQQDEKGQRPSEKGEEKEKKNPPKKVDGIGDEAYWSGNRFGGALYVLKRNVILRVSVGGADTQETKLTKSKGLAEKALSRL